MDCENKKCDNKLTKKGRSKYCSNECRNRDYASYSEPEVKISKKKIPALV